jgi:hypothetical protein
MPKFQLVSAYINLAGDRHNVVHKSKFEPITYPEAMVLTAIHGGEEHVYDMVVQGEVERSAAEEYSRLQSTYGEIVEKVFPKVGNAPMLPEADAQLPTQEEVDASAKASADAAANIRAKRATKTTASKTAAKPEPLPDLPDLADLPS